MRCLLRQTSEERKKRCELRQLRVTLFACTAVEKQSDEPDFLPTISHPQAAQSKLPSDTDKQERRPKDRGLKRKGNKGSKKVTHGRRK